MITQIEFEDLKGQRKEFNDLDEIHLCPHPIKWERDIKSLTTHDVFYFELLS